MATVNLDTASRLDIICRKGDSFELVIDFGVALTETSAANWKMQVATSDTASPALSVEGALSGGPGAETGFSIGANSASVANAQLTVKIKSTTMAGLTSGMYVYDIQSDSNTAGTTAGTVKTHLFGTLKVNEDVTTAGTP